jgi:glycosyltransferase involved in cell wall biosynthesis
VPVLVHFHGSEIGDRARRLANLWTSSRLSVRFVAVSAFSASLLGDVLGAERAVGLLPNPMEIPEAQPSRRSTSPLKIGYVGSRRPWKGLDLLAQVARMLRDEDVEWHIWGIELPSQMTPLVARCIQEFDQAGIADRVHWRGWLSDSAAGYAEMDVLLAPSRRESFGRVVAEGMAVGLPVVASRISGHDELITRDRDGVLFAAGSSVDAATQLRRLIHDPGLRAALGDAARRSALKFDVARVGPQLIGEYERLVVGSPSSSPSQEIGAARFH